MNPQHWRIELAPRLVKKDLKKLDRPVTKKILEAIERLATLEQPQAACKALTGQYSGLWRYRVGNYRIILDIRDNELVIIALKAAHRSAVYKN